MATITDQLKDPWLAYWQLMRLDKPIGTLLLLWPTLWAIWFASDGQPRLDVVIVFSLGVFLMRAAGCVINDFADRKIDGRVARTNQRPLATGRLQSHQALLLFAGLCLAAFVLVVFFTNPLTIQLSVGGVLLAFCYPFMKRYTHLPQVVLGAAFAWAVPMAYAAQSGELPAQVWWLYGAVVLWTVAYDTFYAMVDRDDDLKIGVKSTAVLFGSYDRLITALLQLGTLGLLVMLGGYYGRGAIYFIGVAVAAGLFVYQQWLIRGREREPCFTAFLNNNRVGAAVFLGLMFDYL
ncbi:MAG: 4-hydroxybenzoate octaprenyltransferase [Cellvibrionaceae bacterium]